MSESTPPEKKTSEDFNCPNCGLRAKAEERPTSILARLWRWHTKWCPGWKAYQESLAEAESK